ncbi:MAG: CopD family protein [Gammaproteobacteria bacterium]|nr:CopD family protein [Gammaproteobacteria bacterium]
MSAWYYLGRLHNLTTTPYGRVLLVKLAFVGVAMGLGALNRYVVLPRLRRSAEKPGSRLGLLMCLARSLRLEVAALLGALGGAAVLLHAMPPAAMPPRAFDRPACAANAAHTTPAADQAPRLRLVRVR